MKKIIAIALVICMMMTFASFPAFAGEFERKLTWNDIESVSLQDVNLDKNITGTRETLFDGNTASEKGNGVVYAYFDFNKVNAITINFNEVTDLSKLVIHWGNSAADGTCQTPKKFEIYVGTKGAATGDQEKVYYFEEATAPDGMMRTDTIDFSTLDVKTEEICLIRIRAIETYATGKGRLAVREIEIYENSDGTDIPEIPELADDTVSALGANIRVESDDLSAGLRFGATIDKAKAGIEGTYEYDENADVQFGMFLLPESKLGNAANLVKYLATGVQEAIEVPAKKIVSQDDTTIQYTAVLVDIPAIAWDQVILAVPYVAINGNYTYFEEKEQSYFGVAEAAREDNYSDEAIAAITDPTLKEKMQAIADQLDAIIDEIVAVKTVVPAESDVYSMGRNVNFNDLFYSGAVYEYKFTGSVAGAKFVKASGDAVRFDVSVDGGEFVSYTVNSASATDVIFARGLDASKEHTVRIMRATDIWGPKLTVSGVIVSKDANIVKNYTRDYDLKIEFVGDSITSGIKTPLYAQSYVYLTAEAFNANFNVVSRSGLGLHKNANNGSGGQLKSVYAGIAMEDGNYKYDYDPDIVVLNIGTNDGANVGKLTDDNEKAEYRAAFKEKYVEMLEIIHEKNPNAMIICTGGLMGDFGKVKTQVTEAVELFKAENPDAEVYCEYLSTATDISSETSWHPGVKGHAKGATELIAIIEEILAK